MITEASKKRLGRLEAYGINTMPTVAKVCIKNKRQYEFAAIYNEILLICSDFIRNANQPSEGLFLCDRNGIESLISPKST